MNTIKQVKTRAQAVVQGLAEQFAIDGSRLKAAGKGETEPVDDNATEKGRANNRRVEFVKNIKYIDYENK